MAAALLQGKYKIALLAGGGTRGAGAEIEQLAEKLAAPVIKPMLGKDVIPDDSPLHNVQRWYRRDQAFHSAVIKRKPVREAQNR